MLFRSGLAGVAFAVLWVSAAVRLPQFPLHGWLPPALEEGPLVGLNVYLVGLNLGAYALVRFVLPTLPEPAAAAWLPVTALAFVGIVHGSVVALVQEDLRGAVAYAALPHSGFVLLGMFLLNEHGLEGALVQMVNLGLASSGLILVVGFLHLRAGSTRFADLGGLLPRSPVLSAAFLVLLLTTLGMPGTAGYEGIHLVVRGTLDARHWLEVVPVGLGALLSAVVLLTAWVPGRAGVGGLVGPRNLRCEGRI